MFKILLVNLELIQGKKYRLSTSTMLCSSGFLAKEFQFSQ